MIKKTTVYADSELKTKELGQLIGRKVVAGTTIGLVGELGTGKTRLTQGVALGLGITGDEVVSPTFVLCQQYLGRLMLVHVDAYRITSDNEFLDLGTDEWVNDGAILIVEWADRVKRCLPDDTVLIQLEEVEIESELEQSISNDQLLVDRRKLTISASEEGGHLLTTQIEEWNHSISTEKNNERH